MKKTTTLEPEKKEIKLFKATYPFFFKGKEWPIQVEFTNKIVTDAEPSQDYENGFYEVCSTRGSTEARDQFAGEVLRNHCRRKEFDKWLETQMR